MENAVDSSILAARLSVIFSFTIFLAVVLYSHHIIKKLKEEIDRKNLEIEAVKKQKAAESYEVKDLLGDLMIGRAVVEVRRIDPSEIFLRSMRD